MDKQDAKRAGRQIAKGFGLAGVRFFVISEDTRTKNHFVLGGYTNAREANRARARWEREYHHNTFGAQPYMRVTVEEA